MFRFENNVCFENYKVMRGKLMDSLSSKVIKQIKKPLTVLCCVVDLLARKQLENSKSKEKHEK